MRNYLREKRLRDKLKDARKELEDTLEKNVVNERVDKWLERCINRKVAIPEWTKRSAPGTKRHAAVPFAFLSDTHFDEMVDPRQINHVNGYTRKIAERRLKNFFSNTVKLATDYLKGLKYNGGIVVPFGGDMFSGNIHDELRETNAAALCDSIVHWWPLLAAGLKELADAFGSVLVPCVVGNHTRLTKKPAHKNRVRDNFDWLTYQLVRQGLEADKRISFLISDSSDASFQVLNTRFRLTHGDQFKGGGGISGIETPLALGDFRKSKVAQATNDPYDVLLIADKHQLKPGFSRIVNGSLVGYNEFAFHNNFGFEVPRQAFWITDPSHGVTIFAPIHVKDDNEGWELQQ